MTEELHTNVPCPFCGLLCDDLTATVSGGSVALAENGCVRASRGFRLPGAAVPRVGGRPVTLAEAVQAAARLLAPAHRPLVGGLAADVAGCRAALALAERLGAAVDHMNGDGLFRNLLTLQDRGWMTTTLTEVRNRADLLVVVGTAVTPRFPRFFERFAAAGETVTGERPAPPVIFLGAAPETPPAGSELIPCEPERLAEVTRVLLRLLAGRPPRVETVAGVPLATLARLAERLQAARYSVIAWAAADLDFPHAELTVQALVELVVALNATTRCSGLPLGGSDGDLTATQVSTWQNGHPLRVSFAAGAPDYDPYRHSAGRRLATGTDALLWLSAFDPERTPPESSAPRVVLGHPEMRFGQEPDVFIPVGVPGLHHGGHLFRSDSVVVVPLRRLVASGPPPAAEVLNAIAAALPDKENPAC